MQTTIHNVSNDKKRFTVFLKKAHTYKEKITRVYTQKDFLSDEAVCASMADQTLYKTIQKKVAPLMGARHIILVGIGGSSLGTEAVYHAFKKPTSPLLTVLDSIDVDAVQRLGILLDTISDVSDVVLIVVSKSGTTMETSVNTSLALELFEKRFGHTYTNRVVVISDEKSELYKNAKKRKMLTFTIPPKVGGRYSVCTAVGLVPLTLLGIDTASLMRGCRNVFTSEPFLSASITDAVQLACLAEMGTHTVNVFAFSNRLIGIGFWYRQLLAESIGKSHTRGKKICMHSLQPTVTTSADLHSVTQLYLSGYRGVYTRFLEIENEDDISIPRSSLFSTPPNAELLTTNKVTRVLRKSVRRSYDDAHLPYSHTRIEALDTVTVGALLASFTVEVITYAHLFNINAFDQPHVEQYKQYMREALSSI